MPPVVNSQPESRGQPKRKDSRVIDSKNNGRHMGVIQFPTVTLRGPFIHFKVLKISVCFCDPLLSVSQSSIHFLQTSKIWDFFQWKISKKKKKCLQLPFRTWKWDKFRNILKCQWEYSGTNEIIFSTFYIHFNRHTDRASLMLRLISQLLARFGFRNSRTMVWCSEKNTSSAVHRLEFPSKDLPLNHMSLGCI